MAKNENKSFVKLKNDIKNNTLQKLYVFMGEETYLRDRYAKTILNMIDDAGFEEFNRIVVENGKDALSDLPEILEGFPMMTDRRVICIRDSGVFKKADKEDVSDTKKAVSEAKDYLCEFFKHLSDDSVIIFVENEVDKRNSVYKAAAKYGEIVEFMPLPASDTIAWLIREAKAHNLDITHTNAEYMLTICDNTLGSLSNEMEKLSGFCDKEITKSDIDRLVSKSLQVIVFDLCDHLTARNADKALSLLSDLKTVKEPAFKILYLLFSTFDRILTVKIMMSSGAPNSEIASKLKIPPFIVGKYTKSASEFSFGQLTTLITAVAEYDLKIKEGKTDDWTALEQYICDYFSK